MLADHLQAAKADAKAAREQRERFQIRYSEALTAVQKAYALEKAALDRWEQAIDAAEAQQTVKGMN
jgi:hypothetical protein